MMYSETEHRNTSEEQKIQNLKRQIEHFERKIKQFTGKGLENHIVIKDLTLDHPVLDKLTFHLDEIQLKELSGAMNLGNNFGVNVRPNPQGKTKPKSKQPSSDQQQKTEEKKPEESEQKKKPQQKKKIHVEEKSKPQKPKQQKKKQHLQNEANQPQDEKEPEEKSGSISGESSALPQTSVSPSSSKLKAKRTENGYRIHL